MKPDDSSLSIDAIRLPPTELRMDVHTTAVKDLASAAVGYTETQSNHQLSLKETKITTNVDQPSSERCNERFTEMPNTHSVA
ncbi:hypothetical protein DPMN_050889 [Dreissena polymorpha]|uniref:Uncharacterized protein n=1 Tax=Dreissena polymorpha TaxID=45954 RepID=A0A9D4CIR3_DREPO|nr:hypothetical protein DPMN_050889 [Dreissena polymorpha]